MFKASLLLVSALLMSASAFAMPKAGDSATYDIVVTSGDKTGHGTETDELVQFDSAQNRFLQRTTQQFDGSAPNTSEGWTALDELMDDATADHILAECAGMGGVSQTLQVPAGSFATCALPVNDEEQKTTGTVWVAKVPFGYVRLEVVSGDLTESWVLKSFH